MAPESLLDPLPGLDPVPVFLGERGVSKKEFRFIKASRGQQIILPARLRCFTAPLQKIRVLDMNERSSLFTAFQFFVNAIGLAPPAAQTQTGGATQRGLRRERVLSLDLLPSLNRLAIGA